MSKKISRLIIVVIIAFSAVLGYFIKDLKFNYVFESFFPTDDPELEFFQKFEKLFGNDSNYLLIGLVHEPTIFDSVFLQKVDQLATNLSNQTYVKEVFALSKLTKPVISPAGYFTIPVLHIDSPERYKADSIRIFNDNQLVETLINANATATTILVHHDQLNTKEASDEFLSKIQHEVSSLNFQRVHMAGKMHAQAVFVDKMQLELILFLSASVVLVVVFLVIAFRSWWETLIPLVVVLLSTMWILGIMGLTGKDIDLLMVLLPTIMFVVGMSDVVHLLTKYIEQLRMGDTKYKAIKTTVKEVGLATFLTSLTTAVGFATLMTATIQPIRQFGIYTAIGVFVAYVVTFTLLPACFILLSRPRLSKKPAHRAAWFGFLSRSFIKITRKSGLILTINFILVIVSLYGISKIVINTYLIEGLPADAPLKTDFTFFDENFGGSRPFEITATVEYDSLTIFDPQILNEIEVVEKYLRTKFNAGNVLSPVTIVKSVNQAINGGSSRAYRLPDSPAGWKRLNNYLNRSIKRSPAANLVSKDHTIGRISMRIGDIGSAVSLDRTAALKEFISQHTDQLLVRFRVTGTSNLIDRNNQYLAENMFKGLGIAFFAVALIAGALFRSFRMILITLVPNIIPLLLVAAIMGYFGISLKLSTSIVFTIAFGIAVDDTLHFISKLRIELNKGKSLLYALKRTYLSTGKAIIVTSIILSGGFLILLLSSFGGTFYTGLLVSLTLIFALITDLTLLPVMIMLFYRKNGNKKAKQLT